MQTLHHAPAVRRASALVGRTLDRRAPVAVFAYHSVATVRVDPWDLCVSPEHFEQHLEVLRRRGRVLAADVIGALRIRERLAASSARFALTFDDGYADNLHAALPLLERFEAPATVFVTTGFIGAPSFWWDDLAMLVHGLDLDPTRLRGAAEATGLVAGGHVGELTPDALHAELYGALRALPADAVSSALAEVVGHLGMALPQPEIRPMTEDELLRLAAHPLITIGVHTVTHPRLTQLPPGEARAELDRGRDDLDRRLGVRPRPLAYPFGDVSASVAEIAGRAGFDLAFTTSGRRQPVLPERLLLPRLHPRNVDGSAFERWLAER